MAATPETYLGSQAPWHAPLQGIDFKPYRINETCGSMALATLVVQTHTHVREVKLLLHVSSSKDWYHPTCPSDLVIPTGPNRAQPYLSNRDWSTTPHLFPPRDARSFVSSVENRAWIIEVSRAISSPAWPASARRPERGVWAQRESEAKPPTGRPNRPPFWGFGGEGTSAVRRGV